MLLEVTFPTIDPVAIRIGPLAIHWYALMYLVAFALGYVLMRARLRKEPYSSITKPKPWTKGDVEDILLYAMLGVIVGGRIGYVLFYNFGAFLANPLSIFAIWQGGMSFHGGLVGVMLGLWWFGHRRGRPFLQISDLLVPAAPIGLAAGRIGNFINGELWGRPAPEWLPWAMRFPTGGDVLRHPSQLYQALLEGLLLFVLVWWYARKPRYRGQVSGAFLFGYGVLRFVAEYFRQPDEQLGFLSLGLSMGQWLCVPMILGGAWLWWWSRRRAIWDVEASGDGEVPDEPDEASGEGDAPDESVSVSGERSGEGDAPDEPDEASGETPVTDGTDAEDRP